jgi:hypothetical protein
MIGGLYGNDAIADFRGLFAQIFGEFRLGVFDEMCTHQSFQPRGATYGRLPHWRIGGLIHVKRAAARPGFIAGKPAPADPGWLRALTTKTSAPEPARLFFCSDRASRIRRFKPSSIRADVTAPAIAEIASAAANIDATTTTKATTIATATAATKASTTAAETAAATASCQCLRRGCAHQNGGRADDVNEHQSQRREAARQDTVAFRHFQESPGHSSHLS